MTLDDIPFSPYHTAHSVKQSFSAKGLRVTARRRVLHIKEQCLREDRQEKVLSYGMVEMACTENGRKQNSQKGIIYEFGNNKTER